MKKRLGYLLMVVGLFLSFNSFTSDSEYNPKQIFAANKASANTGGGPIVLDGMNPVLILILGFILTILGYFLSIHKTINK